LEWLGAILLLAYLAGAFVDEQRIALFEKLESKGPDVSADTPVARELLLDFGITKKQMQEIGFVGLQWMSIGDGKPIGGYVYARSVDRENKKRLATLGEFRSWAYADGIAYGWLSFGLVIGGLILKTLGTIGKTESGEDDVRPPPRLDGECGTSDRENGGSSSELEQ